MPSNLPLVSAIMPTRGRAGWAKDAVRMFHEQRYESKELVIIDDQNDPSFPHGISGPGVTHFFAPSLTVGEKRNLAVSRSSGAVILHWDSDDKYRADRIEHAVEMLLAHPEVDLVGYNIMDFEDADTGARYVYNGAPGYAIGVSQCYWRETWEARPFTPVQVGEDEAFIFGRKIYSEPADGRIIARIHNGNTSEKRSLIPQNKIQWRAA